MSQTPALETLAGTRFGLIADAHVHPGKTPPLPAQLNDVFKNVDRIFALGDLGEASGLDWLERIAPVIGVIGGDDVDDRRLQGELRVFAIGGLSIGAVFDGVKHALFLSSDPLTPAPDFAAKIVQRFGRKLDVLLCASTHKPSVAAAGGTLIINPGSPTLADERTVAILHVGDGVVRAEHVRL